MAHVFVWIIVIVAIVYICRKFYRNSKEGKCSCCSDKNNCKIEKSECSEPENSQIEK